jgi:hypothetical protein
MCVSELFQGCSGDRPPSSARYLMGDTSAQALLTGREKLPDEPDVVKVE